MQFAVRAFLLTNADITLLGQCVCWAGAVSAAREVTELGLKGAVKTRAEPWGAGRAGGMGVGGRDVRTWIRTGPPAPVPRSQGAISAFSYCVSDKSLTISLLVFVSNVAMN